METLLPAATPHICKLYFAPSVCVTLSSRETGRGPGQLYVTDEDILAPRGEVLCPRSRSPWLGYSGEPYLKVIIRHLHEIGHRYLKFKSFPKSHKVLHRESADLSPLPDFVNTFY